MGWARRLREIGRTGKKTTVNAKRERTRFGAKVAQRWSERRLATWAKKIKKKDQQRRIVRLKRAKAGGVCVKKEG